MNTIDDLPDSETQYQGERKLQRAKDKNAQLIPGTIVDKFEIVAFVDSGGMGEVWKAVDPVRKNDKNPGHVILKFLKKEFQQDEAAVRKTREAFQIIHDLQHQNICPVHDLREDPTFGWFVFMKYVNGETLSSFRRSSSSGRVDMQSVTRIVTDVAAALQEAHQAGVIHRDIKPANIMIETGGRVQLIDFGLAGSMESDIEQSSGVVAQGGTVAYMAPEQIRVEKQTAATDQYALAVVAWELLAGQRPFPHKEIAVLLQAMENDVLQNVEFSDELLAVFRKALHPDRKQRFESIAAFATAFQRAGLDRAMETTAPMSPTRIASDNLPEESDCYAGPKPVRQQPTVPESVIDILASYTNVSELFVAPNIPEIKERHIRNSVGISDDDPVLAIVEDVSWFGAGGNAITFTMAGIYHRRMWPFTSNTFLGWADVREPAQLRLGNASFLATKDLVVAETTYSLTFMKLNAWTVRELTTSLANILGRDIDEAKAASALSHNSRATRIAAIHESLKTFDNSSGIQVRPFVTHRKERHVRRRADLPDERIVFGLIDLTLLGSADEALILTDIGIHRCGKWVFEPEVQSWDEIAVQNVSVISDTTSPKGLRVGTKTYDLSSNSFLDVENVSKLITALSNVMQHSKNSESRIF